MIITISYCDLKVKALLLTMVMILDNYFDCGKRLKDLRTQRGISQEDLALSAEITTSYLGMIERGEKNPTVKVIEKLCIALGISLGAFFAEKAQSAAYEIDDASAFIAWELQRKTPAQRAAMAEIVRQINKYNSV